MILEGGGNRPKKQKGAVMVEVVAALIKDNGRFLICQRPKDKKRAFLWEFVGGKVEKGETKEEALIRECREELGITVKVKGEFCTVTHNYPDITVRLTVFNADIICGVPTKLEHNDIRWITAEEIDDYAFCPADKEVLEKIKKGKNRKFDSLEDYLAYKKKQ